MAMVIEALTDLSQEVSAWKKAGVFPEDFSARPSGYQTWVDLLQEIDSNPVDVERLKAMKAMFLAANRINATEGESILAYQLFQIAKKLTAGQLLLLRAARERASRKDFKPTDAARRWCEALARELGHNVTGLVEQDEKALVAAGLLTERSFADGSGVRDKAAGRLTDLAEKFCANIETYQADLNSGTAL